MCARAVHVSLNVCCTSALVDLITPSGDKRLISLHFDLSQPLSRQTWLRVERLQFPAVANKRRCWLLGNELIWSHSRCRRLYNQDNAIVCLAFEWADDIERKQSGRVLLDRHLIRTRRFDSAGRKRRFNQCPCEHETVSGNTDGRSLQKLRSLVVSTSCVVVENQTWPKLTVESSA